jgi:oligoribonuclease NrnB/cAMP/cGMP phosphodiesterase (DHH superfamily)
MSDLEFQQDLINKTMANCYRAYTHKDLDGAVSLLTLLWAKPNDIINYKEFNNLNVVETLKKEIESINNPCQTFILDLALRQEFLPDLDKDYITFIDHHSTSSDFISQFKHSKIIHKDTTSNSLLMSSIFKGDKYPARTSAQKILIALADDYDCYRLSIPESYDLNILFWTEYKNNFNKFIKDYSEGFKPFSEKQKKAIKYIKQTAEEEAKTLGLFSGDLNFGNKKKKVMAILAESFSNVVIDILMQRHQPDIFFFINPKTEKVSLRQNNKIDPVNLGTFAEKLCEGGGHLHAAGGKITPLFMEVTKNLKPV